MSIRKRLILSNIAMIIIPIIAFLVIEIILGYFMFVVFNGNPQGKDLSRFIAARFIAMMLILVCTNGLLTFFVAKSILTPIKQLTFAANKMKEGDFEYRIQSDKKDELGELSQTFEAMRSKLHEAQTAQLQYEQNRQELIASISHDLKTPLTSMKGYIKGVQDGIANTPEKLEHYMNTIYTTANEMDSLIDELFLYSKLDIQEMPFHFESVDLIAFFSDFIDELAFGLDDVDDTITFSADSEATFIVTADREKLKRVVLNIHQNSNKYMDKNDQQFHVKLSSHSDEITVEISDNGSGIRQQDLPHIFDRFYRTDRSRNTSTGGSGLGLAIVKKIIEAHGGQVWAKSEFGKGTSIYFTLRKAQVPIWRDSDEIKETR